MLVVYLPSDTGLFPPVCIVLVARLFGRIHVFKRTPCSLLDYQDI